MFDAGETFFAAVYQKLAIWTVFGFWATKKATDPLYGRFMALIYGGNIRAGVPINKRICFCIFSLVEMGGNVNGKREIPVV